MQLINKKEYVIAVFFTASNRIFWKKYFITEDKKTFLKSKKERYVVDVSATVYYTDKGEPVYFYIEGMPNPLKFNFAKEQIQYIKEKRENPLKTVIRKNEKGEDTKEVVDISFSSINLELYKNDTTLQHLMNIKPQHMQIILLLGGLVALSLMVILIMVIIRR